MSKNAQSLSFINPNLGKIDQYARFILSAAMIGFVLLTFDEETAVQQQWMTIALFAIPLAITAIIRWDPLYALLHIHTTATDRWQNASGNENFPPNLSILQRAIRFAVAAVLIGVGMAFPEGMTWQPYAILAAIPIAITAIIGWAPIEAMFRHDNGKRGPSAPIVINKVITSH